MQGGVGFRAEVGIGKETWMRAKETRDEGGIVEVDCAAEADGRFDHFVDLIVDDEGLCLSPARS